ncbi:MAG: LysM peptidoglycan-binding domain-containing protein, partial [Anaerolineae bacterium]|nr:LysM peptidoglycan-binding domain-containing protein [Anaerolineae bacterium]
MYNTQLSQPSAPQQQFPPSQPIQAPQPPVQPGRRPPPKNPIDKRLYWIAGGVAVLGIAACGALLGLILLIYIAQPRVPDGVRVAGLVIGGETLDDAETILEKGYAAQTVRLTDADRAWNVPINELGITVNIDETLKQAEKAAKNAVLEPVYAIDFPQTQAKLINLSAEINVAPVNGNPPQDGKSVDIPFVLDRLRLDLPGEIADGVVELNMIEVAGQADTNADYTGIQTQHTVAAGEELGLIAKKYNVNISEVVSLNNIDNPDLLYVGQVLTIPAGGVYEPTAADAPPAPTGTGRSILVSTENQRIYAYENG